MKIAVCLEMMRARYLSLAGKTSLISEREFSRNVEALMTSIKSLLVRILPSFAGELDDAKTSLLSKMTKNTHGMNNYPFRSALQEMCQIAHLDVLPDELKRIVAIRNNLVHEGRYKLGLGTPYEQYKLLSGFVGCFLMAALGSQNWSKGIEWIIAPDEGQAHSDTR